MVKRWIVIFFFLSFIYPKGNWVLGSDINFEAINFESLKAVQKFFALYSSPVHHDPALAAQEIKDMVYVTHTMFEVAQVSTNLLLNPMLFSAYAQFQRGIHIKRLKEIMTVYPWFFPPQFNAETSEEAFSLVLYVKHDLEFQRKVLEFFRECWELEKNIPGSWIANLTDTICLSEGRTQIYGTHYEVLEDGRIYIPTQDSLPIVNQMRAELGMEPIEQYIKNLQLAFQASPSISPSQRD